VIEPIGRREQVDTLVLEREIERHVVDTGSAVGDLVGSDPEVVTDLVCRSLHAVTQAHRRDVGQSVQRPAVHRHRVHVVEMQHVGAQLLHVVEHLLHHRDGAQGAHDPADAERVGDRLTQPVLLRDLEVDHRRRPVPADLDHADRVVGTVECGSPVGGRHHRRVRAESGCDPMSDLLARRETHGVDVVQDDLARRQFGVREDVAHQVAGEDRATGADEDDACHDGRI
jgi:hypothetical protein